jgi:uncharacterized protein
VIIDAHTHVFPPWVIAERERYCQRDHWFDLLYSNPSAQLASPDDLLVSMDAAGIAQSVLCGFPWADPALCREHSEWMAEVCRARPERFSFLAIVVPHAPDALAAVQHAKGLAARGIGELNADAQQFDLRDPETLAAFMDACHAEELPVMLHASEPLGHQYPGKGAATPDALATFLARFPDQPVVLAHWGGGLPFYELMPEIHAVTRNTCYDSAASTYLYAHRVIDIVVRIIGPERVLYASDYPVLSQGRLARRFERMLTDDTARDNVLRGNAARVYGLAKGSAR